MRLLAQKIFKTTAGGVLEGVGDKTDIDYAELFTTILLKFINVLEAAVIIAISVFVVRFLKRYFVKTEAMHERQRTAFNLLEKITSGFIMVVGVTLALKVVGLDLVLILSVLTLGLSFGMRDVIKNYVAGLLILLKSPFEIGDIVKIRTFIGKVEKIEFQSTTIRTFDRKEITIHNSDLLTQPIINYSKTEQRRLEMELLLGYGSDMGRAMQIFNKILQVHQDVLKEPKYSIVFREFVEHGIKVLIRFWVQRPCNPLRLRSQLALQIQEAFDEAQIFTPYNREAGLVSDFGMTEARKQRIKAFYGQPMLAEIAGQTFAQIAGATANGAVTANGATAATEAYIDADEPE